MSHVKVDIFQEVSKYYKNKNETGYFSLFSIKNGILVQVIENYSYEKTLFLAIFRLKTPNFDPKYWYDTHKPIYFRKGHEKIHKIISFYQFSSKNKRARIFLHKWHKVVTEILNCVVPFYPRSTRLLILYHMQYPVQMSTLFHI